MTENLISIDKLKIHPKNQEYFSDPPSEKYEEIKQSIEANGIRDPLKVLPDYTIIAGHQRYKIAKELGLEKVPVIIYEISEEEAEYLLIADNEERRQEDNDPIKKAKRARFLKEYWGVKQGTRSDLGQNGLSSIARAINENERTTKRLLKLNDLIPEFQELVSEKKLGTTAAEQLAYLELETQKALWQTLGEELENKTLSEVKEIRKKMEETQKELKEKENFQKEAEEKTIQLSEKIKDAEKTIEEYKSQICNLEKEIEQLKENPKKIEVIPEDYEKINTEIKNKREKLKSLKAELQEKDKTFQEIKTEKKNKKEELRTLTKAQIEAKNRQKVRSTLTYLVQDVGKHLKRARIEIESFAVNEDIYEDVKGAAKILKEAAGELEAMVRVHDCEVIDIAGRTREPNTNRN